MKKYMEYAYATVKCQFCGTEFDCKWLPKKIGKNEGCIWKEAIDNVIKGEFRNINGFYNVLVDCPKCGLGNSYRTNENGEISK